MEKHANVNFLCDRGSSLMLRNVSLFIFLTLIQSGVHGRILRGIDYPRISSDDDGTAPTCNHLVRGSAAAAKKRRRDNIPNISDLRCKLPIVGPLPSGSGDVDLIVYFFKNRAYIAYHNDKYNSVLIFTDAIMDVLQMGIGHIDCPISSLRMRKSLKNSHGLTPPKDDSDDDDDDDDDDDNGYYDNISIPHRMTAFTALLHESIQHVHRIIYLLSRKLGVQHWAAPPRDLKTIAAWNEILHFTGAYIEPHCPSQLEHAEYARREAMTQTERIAEDMEKMKVQSKHIPVEAFNFTTMSANYSIGNMLVDDWFDNESPRYTSTHVLYADLCHTPSSVRDDDTHNYASAVRIEEDYKSANYDIGGCCTYAPHGLRVTISTNGVSCESIIYDVECNDPRRMLGKVALYLFFAMHAHHVRSLDLRTKGNVVILEHDTSDTIPHTLLDVLLGRGLRLCTQISVLTGDLETVVSACAASLATTVRLLEVEARGDFRISGPDAYCAAPYACSELEIRVTSLQLSQLRWNWFDRLSKRLPPNQARIHVVKTNDPACLLEVERVTNAIAFGCVPDELREIAITTKYQNTVNIHSVCKLLFPPNITFSKLKVLKLHGFIWNEEGGEDGFTFFERTPNLQVCSFRCKDRTFGGESDAAFLADLVGKRLPRSVTELWIDVIPPEGRPNFFEAVSGSGLRTVHCSLSKHLYADMEPPQLRKRFSVEPKGDECGYDLFNATSGTFTCYSETTALLEGTGLTSLYVIMDEEDDFRDNAMYCLYNSVFRTNAILPNLTSLTIRFGKAKRMNMWDSYFVMDRHDIGVSRYDDDKWVVECDRLTECEFTQELVNSSTLHEQLRELRLLFTHKNVDNARRVGEWVAKRAERLCSFAFWSLNDDCTNELCDAIMEAGGPCPNLTRISTCVTSATFKSTSALYNSVALNKAELIHALNLTLEVCTGNESRGEEKDWKWIAFLAYRQHPHFLQMLREI
ncbi:hypothetical protein HPB48_012009 [Haemaphysalis longicornis]|uniref:Uncharacterized protein n=1 Tax=Haemaphysalis longicornis TaxID=44386 RepID=A0A9J6G924_HAELO|nr:hypothetical protein HPB48_012009 [Haemaphysalis longicornis]